MLHAELDTQHKQLQLRTIISIKPTLFLHAYEIGEILHSKGALLFNICVSLPHVLP